MSRIKQTIKSIYHNVKLWCERNTEIGYWRCAKTRYFSVTGKHLNYRHPMDLNEKLMWIERYWQHPLKTICADKYQVRDYIKRQGMEDTLIPLLGVWDTVDDIDFNILPKQFVLKCNHGSAYNIICLDKSKLDIADTKNKLKQWLNEDFSQLYQEIHYHDIPHKIICEQLISETAPIEYQLWCVNGKAQSFLICNKNYGGTYDAWSYSLDWQPLYDRKAESKGFPPKPHNISQLIRYAELLAEPFPFIRVDFYEVNGNTYFAEMTFSPSTNILSNYKDEFIERMGKLLVLPKHEWPSTNWKKWKKNAEYVEKFVEEMNIMAPSIGMLTAHFDDPTGLSYRNIGSVYDVAKLIREALLIPEVCNKMRVQHTDIWVIDRGIRLKRMHMENTLHINEFDNEGCQIIAAKTGSDGYRYNVGLAVKNGNDTYIIAILNAATEQRRTICIRELLKYITKKNQPSMGQTESALICKMNFDNELSEVFSHNKNLQYPLLSITKVLSVVIVQKYIHKLSMLVQIKDCDVQRGSGIPLRRRAILSSKAAVYTTLISSSNTAIHALARKVGKII